MASASDSCGILFFFSVILQISPHYHRTIASYIGALIAMIWRVDLAAVWIGFILITAAVLVRMLTSPKEEEKMRVRFLWMR